MLKREIMRAVIQRVTHASVKVDGSVCGQIGRGFLILAGISVNDTEEIVRKMAEKISRLRIFEDENGKTNKSLADVNGEVLLVSQFTLYADCRRGNRPGFTYAGEPKMAEGMYEYIIRKVKEQVPVVQKGIFGADMKLSLTNEGPFTILLDSDELFR